MGREGGGESNFGIVLVFVLCFVEIFRESERFGGGSREGVYGEYECVIDTIGFNRVLNVQKEEELIE